MIKNIFRALVLVWKCLHAVRETSSKEVDNLRQMVSFQRQSLAMLVDIVGSHYIGDDSSLSDLREILAAQATILESMSRTHDRMEFHFDQANAILAELEQHVERLREDD